MIACVVFDFDGTLVDSNAIKRQAFFTVAAQFSKDSEAIMEQCLSAALGGRQAVFAEYARRMAESGLRLDAHELTESYGREADQKVATAREMPGASGLLQALRARNCRIHLSSATPLESLLRILEWRGWADRFDGIHGLPRRKAETLVSILGNERLVPGQIAVVGDGHDDEHAAAAVGCHFIPVGAGTYQPRIAGREAIPLERVAGRLRLLSVSEAVA